MIIPIGLLVFIMTQVVLGIILGARRDGESPTTLEFWRS